MYTSNQTDNQADNDNGHGENSWGESEATAAVTGPDNHLSSVYKSGTPGDNKHLLRKKIVTLVVWCRGRDQESPGAAFPWLVPLLVTALVTADGGAGSEPVSSRVT